jgi:hypothetical protein
MKIAITLEEDASMHAAILDCARSIAAGYGAGTLTDEDNEFLGFWTSIPNDIEKYDLVVEIPKDMEDEDYLVAGIVRRKAKEYEEN